MSLTPFGAYGKGLQDEEMRRGGDELRGAGKLEQLKNAAAHISAFACWLHFVPVRC